MGLNEYFVRTRIVDAEASNSRIQQEIELVRGSVAQTSVVEQ